MPAGRMTKYSGSPADSINAVSGRQKRVKAPRVRRLRGKQTVAKKAFVMAKQAKKALALLAPELHYSETTIGYSIDWVGNAAVYFQDLASISQGDTDLTRDGDKIRAQTIFFNYRVEFGTTPTNTSVRLLIINDKFSSVTSPSLLLTDTGSIYATAGMQIWDYLNEADILFDKTIDLDTVGNPSTSGSVKINLRNKLVEFAAGSTTAILNRYRFMAVSNIDAAAAAATKPLVYARSRFVYSDI